MGGFKFSLESVLKIKNQLNDVLKLEYATISAEVSEQEKYIRELELELIQKNDEFNDKNAIGMTSLEISVYKNYFKEQQFKIKKAYQKLEEINERLVIKREEIIESKKEISSIEKLKEKRFAEYEYSAKKAEELFIEEFVSNKIT